MKPIKTEPQSIRDLFEGYEFIIPDYQRGYSWDREDCVALCEDVLSYIDPDSEQEEYYLGCIVVYPNKNNTKIWNIIDGQQRITTLLMLINVLFSHTKTLSRLERMMYKINEETGSIETVLRLESDVVGDRGKNDRDDFNKVMKGKKDTLEKNNIFRVNYEKIQSVIDDWVIKFSAEKLDDNIKNIVKGLVMLPIECTAREDALILFESINNRGKDLTDADIFKSIMYQRYSGDDQQQFVERWGALGNNHVDLFRSYMHIQRAFDEESSKRVNLRKYIMNEKLKDVSSKEADDILEKLNKIYATKRIATHKESICTDKPFQNKDFIYWHILSAYPNVYCRYPLFAFIDKYGKFSDGKFKLENDRQHEYIKLLKNTIRYFYTKGVVHNSVDEVREVSHRACLAIYHEGKEGYVPVHEVYKKDVSKTEKTDFYNKIKSSDYGRCRQGLVVLNSLLNERQDPYEYAKVLGKVYDIEHILPNKWCNYDQWTKKSYDNNIERIGNLMPLEKKTNIRASNEFFGRKQEEYNKSEEEKSKVQDALDLSKKDPKTWYPADVEERHQEAMERLRKFFEDFE